MQRLKLYGMDLVMFPILFALLSLPAMMPGLGFSRKQAASILQERNENVRLRLLDAYSAGPVSDTQVEIESDNGVRCIQAPCPTDGREWRGRSDSHGYVVVPMGMLAANTILRTPVHSAGKDLIHDSERQTDGVWTVELFPDRLADSSEGGLRPIKLIDSRTGLPLGLAEVNLAFGSGEELSLKTNALGYVFVPFEKALKEIDNTWAMVPGYRRTKLDFAWVSYRTLMQRLP